MDFKAVCGDEIKYGTRFDNNVYMYSVLVKSSNL